MHALLAIMNKPVRTLSSRQVRESALDGLRGAEGLPCRVCPFVGPHGRALSGRSTNKFAARFTIPSA